MEKNEIQMKKGFIAYRHQGNQNESVLTDPKRDYLVMRPNQLEVYQQHRDKQHVILRQPPGAGKSATIKFCFTEYLATHPEAKLLITVPQNMIESSYGTDFLEYPDGRRLLFRLSNENNPAKYGKDKVSKIINFLEKTQFTENEDRIMVCSHAGFVAAFNRLNKMLPLHNMCFNIDEAHHILASGDNEESCNGLGEVAKYILHYGDSSCRLWLTTATYFRGDQFSIFTPEDEKLFEHYFYPLDRYFASLKYIQSYSYDYIPYKGDFPERELHLLLGNKENHKKTIMYLPAEGSMWTNGNKKDTVERLTNSIHQVWSGAKIINLVDTNGRKERKNDFIENKYSSDKDIVFTIRMLDEGVDWPEAEQVIDLFPSQSLRIAIQRFGRIIRDNPGKTHLNYYVFFPCSLDDKEMVRNSLSENFATLSASLIIEEAIQPVRFPTIPTGITRIQNEKPFNYFQAFVPDETIRQEIYLNVSISIAKLRCDSKDSDVSSKDFHDCVKYVLKSHNVNQYTDEIALEIEMIYLRRVMREIPSYEGNTQGLLEAGFDKIQWKAITDYIFHFVSGRCDKQTLKECRDYFNGKNKTLQEFYQIALSLANNNGGKLHNMKWLLNNGYNDLVRAMYKSPETFQDIPQHRLIKTLQEHKETALKLAAEHDGILPIRYWLKQNGYGDLLGAIKHNPEVFQDIPQDRKGGNTVDKHLKTALRLADENDGILYSEAWLRKHGHNDLTRAIYRHPEIFKDIPQEKEHKTYSEHLETAIRLAKENGGILPYGRWLKNNGYNDLYSYIAILPKLFQGIKMYKYVGMTKTIITL